MKDLVVVVADGALQEILKTLIGERRASLGLRPITFDVTKDPLHDSSSPANAVSILRGCLRTHQRALILRDLEGSGWERQGAKVLEHELEKALMANGWKEDAAAAIVLDPEVEIWLRFDSAHIETLLRDRTRKPLPPGWNYATLKAGIVAGYGGEHNGKPIRPKEVFEALLASQRIPRSNALYHVLAKKESLVGCQVPSFLKLRTILHQWFHE
jgi:hypothetical protein